MIHDSIRGQGTFAKVKEHTVLLRQNGKAELIMMSVMAPRSLPYFSKVPFGLEFDRAILHKMIYLTEEECRLLPKGSFERWHRNEVDSYEKELSHTLKELEEIVFPIPVEFQKHNTDCICREPYRHLHINSRGEASFCTDFNHYSLGNITKHSWQEIFEGEKAQDFRKKGNAPFCAHCSWKNTQESILKFKCR